MNLDSEVRTWTENISEDALVDVLHAIERRVRRLDRTHDIPYIAGYSNDGRTIFIDRHLPRSFSWRGKRIETDRFLVLHEMVEKTLLDQLRLHYLHAHQIALRIEQAAVRASGIRWHDYNKFTKSHEKEIDEELLKRVPRSLDLTPYKDEHDFAKLKNLVRVGRATRR
jgi:hypothetical protein